MPPEHQPSYKVVATADPSLPFVLVDASDTPMQVVVDYLRELAASDCSPLTIRSYAFDLLGWLRFLSGLGVPWTDATRIHVRDYVLMLRNTRNPQRRLQSTPDETATSRTGKPPRGVGYAPATINHRLAVLSSFYEFAGRTGAGPSLNPVPGTGPGDRPFAHRSPMEEHMPVRRGGYRQKMPALIPRALADDLYSEVFGALTSDRDRAIVALLVSSGARASELLGMNDADVDWGGQPVRLVGKGTRSPRLAKVSPVEETGKANPASRGARQPGQEKAPSGNRTRSKTSCVSTNRTSFAPAQRAEPDHRCASTSHQRAAAHARRASTRTSAPSRHDRTSHLLSRSTGLSPGPRQPTGTTDLDNAASTARFALSGERSLVRHSGWRRRTPRSARDPDGTRARREPRARTISSDTTARRPRSSRRRDLPPQPEPDRPTTHRARQDCRSRPP